MRQRGVVRLAFVLALVLGLVWSLMSRRSPEFPLAVDIFGNWMLNAALLFVVLWLVLSLVAWAVRGFSSTQPPPRAGSPRIPR